jgi:hypothetical protein
MTERTAALILGTRPIRSARGAATVPEQEVVQVIRKSGMAAAAGLAVAATTLLLPASSASAGSSCSLLGCSTTSNQSGYSALAVRDWTCGSGTTGTASTGCVSLATTKWLNPGAWTPAGEDWDAFRVDAGWCYRVRLVLPYKQWNMTYNRSGMSTPVYVKVENDGIAYIQSQGYGYCP